jgi:hypothetical protein
MDRATVLVRVLASGFTLAGVAAIFLWFWPGEAEPEHFRGIVAVLSAIVAAAVLVSLWRK